MSAGPGGCRSQTRGPESARLFPPQPSGHAWGTGDMDRTPALLLGFPPPCPRAPPLGSQQTDQLPLPPLAVGHRQGSQASSGGGYVLGPQEAATSLLRAPSSLSCADPWPPHPAASRSVPRFHLVHTQEPVTCVPGLVDSQAAVWRVDGRGQCVTLRCQKFWLRTLCQCRFLLSHCTPPAEGASWQCCRPSL